MSLEFFRSPIESLISAVTSLASSDLANESTVDLTSNLASTAVSTFVSSNVVSDNVTLTEQPMCLLSEQLTKVLEAPIHGPVNSALFGPEQSFVLDSLDKARQPVEQIISTLTSDEVASNPLIAALTGHPYLAGAGTAAATLLIGGLALRHCYKRKDDITAKVSEKTTRLVEETSEFVTTNIASLDEVIKKHLDTLGSELGAALEGLNLRSLATLFLAASGKVKPKNKAQSEKFDAVRSVMDAIIETTPLKDYDLISYLKKYDIFGDKELKGLLAYVAEKLVQPEKKDVLTRCAGKDSATALTNLVKEICLEAPNYKAAKQLEATQDDKSEKKVTNKV